MPRIRVPEEPNRIYGSVPLGANGELLLLDERQYRDPQPCGDEVGRPCSDSERNAPRTLLGAEQKRWLQDRLRDSPAAWKLVANQVMIMSLDVPARNAVNPDQWDGYGGERRELLATAQAEGIEGIAFLTGDIHTFFAGQVTPAGRQGLPTDGAPAAVEFVGGAITSKGLGDDFAAGGVGVDLSTGSAVRSNNPHIVYSNLTRKGYAVLEARADELLVDYRAPQSTQTPRSPMETLARFRVGHGSNQVERVDGPV